MVIILRTRSIDKDKKFDRNSDMELMEIHLHFIIMCMTKLFYENKDFYYVKESNNKFWYKGIILLRMNS